MAHDNKFEEIKTKVEALLFAYADFLTNQEIMQALSIDSSKLVENSIKELKEKYKENYPFNIQEDDSGRTRMALKDEYEDTVSELVSGVEIPLPILKVLSVIAYEQPVTKTRLNEILGRAVKQEVDYLFKAKFVNYEKHGNGRYYRVTKKFYDYFKIDKEDDFREKANLNLNLSLLEIPDVKASPEEEQKNDEKI